MGEFLALAVSLEHMAEKYSSNRCKILGQSLDKATEKLLLENKSPTRKLGGIDNRGSHFYIAYYWAEALCKQQQDKELSGIFEELYNPDIPFNARDINELINNKPEIAKINSRQIHLKRWDNHTGIRREFD